MPTSRSAADSASDGARVVWITGAAGGLGQELVRVFAAHEWRVAACGHRQAPAVPEGPTVWRSALDVTDASAVDAFVAALLEKWGRIDALINNAGVTADDASWQLSDSAWDRVLAVNLGGAFHCARAAVRSMIRQRRGHIINLSSFAGRAGARGQANYAAAKAGLIGFSASLAREIGARNVRVNTVLPGVLPTPMTAALSEEQRTKLVAANVLGRINSLDEVARFVAFLATLENVSGQVFQLDSRIASWS